MQILFVTATRIGDAVLSTGLLSHLVERHPAAEFTIAAGPPAAPLFRAVPRLRRLITLEKRSWSRHWLELYAAVAGRRWDLVVDLRGSALAWLLATRERRIMAKGEAGEHRVRQLARLFELDPPPAPRLWTAPEDDRRAAFLAPPGPPILAVGPAANWRAKQWRAERFAELARRLAGPGGPLPGARVAVMAAAHERPQAEPLLAALPAGQAIDLVGRVDLLAAAALLRRAALYVGNDTGLTHIAAAAGAPTLALFGPTPVEQYGPWGPHAAVAATPVPPAMLMGAEGWDYRTSDTLMDSLTVEAAEEAARRLFARVRGAARAAP